MERRLGECRAGGALIIAPKHRITYTHLLSCHCVPPHNDRVLELQRGVPRTMTLYPVIVHGACYDSAEHWIL